jgi:hypothetical protein
MRTELGDFTVRPRMLTITALALVVGGAGAVAAFALLRLIGFLTNLIFYQRISVAMVSPGEGHHPWWLVLLAPVAGGLIVGQIPVGVAPIGMEAQPCWCVRDGRGLRPVCPHLGSGLGAVRRRARMEQAWPPRMLAERFRQREGSSYPVVRGSFALSCRVTGVISGAEVWREQ